MTAFGRYLLLDRIGKNQAPETYRARSSSSSSVVIKRFLPSAEMDPGFPEKFRDEMVRVGQLHHPNIGGVDEIGRLDGILFVARKHIEGYDLRQILARLRRDERRMAVAVACFIVGRLLEGLDYAHRKHDPNGSWLELRHGGFSPSNVVVSTEGEVKLVDFGIASLRSDARGLTADRLGYLSPEQASGAPWDRRSDIYAVGALLYECLTGEPPFRAETDLDPNIPSGVVRVMHRALSNTADERYQWCSEMLADLQASYVAPDLEVTPRSVSTWLAALFGPTPEPGDFEEEESSPTGSVREAPIDFDPLVRANTAFALDLFERMRASPGNLAMSPASISIALALALNGATGSTASELARLLHLDGTLHRQWGAFAGELHGRRFELRFANRLYGDRGFPFEATYLRRTEAAFGAAIESVDFAGDPEAARARINRWVEARTENRIEHLLPPGAVDPATRLALVNAVYFLAAWKTPFIPGRTRPQPFTLANGTQKSVLMMHALQVLSLAKVPGARILELPYTGDAAMWIVLPDRHDGLAVVEDSLRPATLDAWTTAFQSTHVDVALPRFTIDPSFATDLAGHLRGLGVRLAFDPDAADFSPMGISQGFGLYLSNVFHKAFVRVDEQGTEAAAATAVVMMVAGAGRQPPPSEPFIVDHPFLFFIVDKHTQLVLFMGRVADPS